MTVPAVIAKNQTTVVHLYGRVPQLKNNVATLTDLVTLPNEQIPPMKPSAAVPPVNLMNYMITVE